MSAWLDPCLLGLIRVRLVHSTHAPLSEAVIPPDLLNSLVFVLCRYLHVVCTTLLVGGTLFYEMVVPVAIGELKQESQLAVFGRARWVFRWIVWLCALILVVTGTMMTRQYWYYYTAQNLVEAPQYRPGWWWAAHMTSGSIAIVISLMLTIGSEPPEKPVTWMRFNLVLLLVVMFIASITRHVRDLQVSPPPPFIQNPAMFGVGEDDAPPASPLPVGAPSPATPAHPDPAVPNGNHP